MAEVVAPAQGAFSIVPVLHRPEIAPAFQQLALLIGGRRCTWLMLLFGRIRRAFIRSRRRASYLQSLKQVRELIRDLSPNDRLVALTEHLTERLSVFGLHPLAFVSERHDQASGFRGSQSVFDVGFEIR